MSNPRVSLVVPFYNVARYIGDCLASIQAQTLKDFEALLVDDGSTDASLEIADAYLAADDRFVLSRQANRGLSAARNAVIPNATGDYLMFLDSDDLLAPRALELLAARLDETGSSLAVGNGRRFDRLGSEPSWGQMRSAARDRSATTVFAFPALAQDRVVANKMFRRSFWEEHQYRFPEMMYEDYPIVLAALIAADGVDCLREPVHYWRRREDDTSITQRSADAANALDRIASARIVLDLVDEHGSAVAAEVHDLLARIDVPAVFLAFGGAAAEEADLLLDGLTAMVARLRSPALSPRSGFLALQLAALRNRDHRTLRALAQHRLTGGDEWTDRTRRSRTRPWRQEYVLPGARTWPRPVPARRYLVPYWRHRLRTSVDDVRFDGSDLLVSGSASIAHVPGSPSVRVVAMCESRTVGASIERLDPHGRFAARLGIPALGVEPRTWTVAVEVRQAWWRRRGNLVHETAATRPSVAASDADAARRVLPRFGASGAIEIDVLDRAVFATGLAVSDESARIGLAGPLNTTLVLRRDDGSVRTLRPVRADGGDASVEIDLRPLRDDPPADDPATGIATSALLDGGSGRPVLVGSRGPAGRWTSGDWMIAVTRSADGALVLQRSRPVPTVDVIDVVGDGIDLVGGGPAPKKLEWRAAADGLAVPVEVVAVGNRWHASTRSTELARVLGRSAYGATALLDADGRPVRLDGFAAASLPVYAPAPGGPIRLGGRGIGIEATRS